MVALSCIIEKPRRGVYDKLTLTLIVFGIKWQT